MFAVVAKSRPVRHIVSLVPAFSTWRSSSNPNPVSREKLEARCQSPNIVSTEKSYATVWSTDDVRSSLEWERDWNEPIGTEQPGAPQGGGNATERDLALDYISDAKINFEFKTKFIRNFQQKLMVPESIQYDFSASEAFCGIFIQSCF